MRPNLIALAVMALAMPACRRTTAPADLPREAPGEAPHREPPAPVAAPTLRAFSWDRLLLVSHTTLGGPGLASVAEVGRQVTVRGGDGEPWTARIETVADDGCEDEPGEACRYVALAYGREGDAFPAGVQWQRVAMQGDEHLPEDIAVLDVNLAVDIDTALPRLVPHTLEVRYANALCEDEADAEHYSLVRVYTSAGPDPMEGVPALDGKMQYPRRVVTLRTLGRTLHFVTIAQVDRPASGRMFDIAKPREVAMWVLEGEGERAKVLHHVSHASARSMNVDISCQLPLRYPTPWSVVEVEGSIHVLTQSNLTDFERWSLEHDGLVREGGWTADIHHLF